MTMLRQLYIQVLIAIVVAVVLGIVDPGLAVQMKPLGDAFIALLRMLLAPIIFCSVVLGLTHVRDMGQLGRLAVEALLKLAATLQTVRTLPLNGLGLLFGIDRLMATCTALTNVVGNTAAVFMVAKWEDAFDLQRFEAYLADQAAGLVRQDRGVISAKGGVNHARA